MARSDHRSDGPLEVDGRLGLRAHVLGGHAGRQLAQDEPTAGVDVAGEQEVVDLVLDEMRRRGAGAIWVGHGIRALEAASTRVLDLGARP